MIQDIIISHFKLNPERSNEWQSVNCPLHNDQNASAGILLNGYSGVGIFKCQAGCGSFTLATMIGKLNLEVSNNLNTSFDNISDKLFDVFDEPVWNAKPLPLKKHVTEYSNFLIEKGLSDEIVRKFNGQYVSDSNDKLCGYLRFNYGRDNSRYVARRIIPVTQANEPRFYNSHGNKTLFGYEYVKTEKTVILCEGITDFLSLQEMEISNCVATFGAEVSNQQMYLLRGQNVFILFDKDYAGFEGSKKAYDILKRLGSNPIVLEIPSYFAGDSDDKIDVNIAYIYNRELFKVWLLGEIKKYSMFDTEYVSKFITGNASYTKYYKTGIQEWDDALCGGIATGVHAIAGMPEAGKSTLVSHLIDNFIQQGARVLTCSYELTKEQIYARLASRFSNLSWVKIEKGMQLEDKAAKELSRISNYLKVDSDWSIEEIKHASDSFDIIIIDYIQRMFGKAEEERQRIKDNINGLSNLARHHNKVVIVISSMPRSSYGNNTGKDVFKETGSIEYVSQSAYVFSKIHKDLAMLSIVKNTRGHSGVSIYLKPDYQHQRLEQTDLIEEIYGESK